MCCFCLMTPTRAVGFSGELRDIAFLYCMTMFIQSITGSIYTPQDTRQMIYFFNDCLNLRLQIHMYPPISRPRVRPAEKYGSGLPISRRKRSMIVVAYPC
jgi:hypothetical protein